MASQFVKLSGATGGGGGGGGVTSVNGISGIIDILAADSSIVVTESGQSISIQSQLYIGEPISGGSNFDILFVNSEAIQQDSAFSYVPGPPGCGNFTTDNVFTQNINCQNSISGPQTISGTTILATCSVQSDGNLIIASGLSTDGGGITSDGSSNLQVNGTLGVGGVLTAESDLTVEGVFSSDSGAITTNGAGAMSLTGLSMSGSISTYNNIGTAGEGVPAIYAAYSNTSGSSIGLTTLYAVPAGQQGTYLITVYLNTATAGSAGSVNCTIGWTDQTGARTQTTSNVILSTVTGNTAFISQALVLFAKTSTNITFSTTVTSAVGSPTYDIYLNAAKYS